MDADSLTLEDPFSQVTLKESYHESDWENWKWQLSHSLSTKDDLSKLLTLTDDESAALDRNGLPFRLTPYYANLIDPNDPNDPIRRCVVPNCQELVCHPEEELDPLHEDVTSPLEGLVHRYPDRVLFLVTDFCSVCCRYCTRSRVVGQGDLAPNKQRWDRAITYIAQHSEVRDVLLSGGDPLTLPDSSLQYLLERLRAIPHVEIIRIGTKVPVVLPQRITPSLVEILSAYHPLWMSIHFTHPREITAEVEWACDLLTRGGIPLGSQTVLLKGINDNIDTMRSLMHNLLKIRVRPYYLYQCDPIIGSRQFRTPIETGLDIISKLRGYTSGYAVPQFVIDAPKGGGKIALLPDAVIRTTDTEIILKNYEGNEFSYPTVCS